MQPCRSPKCMHNPPPGAGYAQQRGLRPITSNQLPEGRHGEVDLQMWWRAANAGTQTSHCIHHHSIHIPSTHAAHMALFGLDSLEGSTLLPEAIRWLHPRPKWLRPPPPPLSHAAIHPSLSAPVALSISQTTIAMLVHLNRHRPITQISPISAKSFASPQWSPHLRSAWRSFKIAKDDWPATHLPLQSLSIRSTVRAKFY